MARGHGPRLTGRGDCGIVLQWWCTAVSEASAKTPATTPAPPRRLGVELQGRIDDYVAHADAALARRQVPPEQRRSVAVALRSQILDKIAARVAPDRPTGAADVDAVLAELGPADSPQRLQALGYAAPPAPPRTPGDSRLSLTALAGALWAPLFFIMLLLSSVQLEVKPGQAPPIWQRPVQLVVIPLGWAAPFATTVLGLLALGNIQRSHGAQYGLSVALFDAMFFPLLLVDFLVFWLSWQIANAIGAPDMMGQAATNLIFHQAIPTVLCVLGDYYLVNRAWAAVQPDATGAGPHPPAHR